MISAESRESGDDKLCPINILKLLYQMPFGILPAHLSSL